MTACGKVTYLTKQEAKQAKRRQPGRHLRVYTCAVCRGFHLGHLPQVIIQGVRTRGDLFGDAHQ